MKDISIKMLMAVFVFLAPIHTMLISITLFVLVDFVTGVYAAYKQNILIESKRMRDSVGKLISYYLLIILGFLLDKYFIVPVVESSFFFNVFACILGVTEFKSVLENIDKIMGTNFFKVIKNIFAQNKALKQIDDITNDKVD